MRIFKTWYTEKKTGRRKEAAKWYVESKDHLDRRHRSPALTDERRSYAFKAKVEKLVSVRSGGGELDNQLSNDTSADSGGLNATLSGVWRWLDYQGKC